MITFRLNGATFRPIEAREIVTELRPGAVLSLESEPDNPYDKNAIKVLCDSVHIGYVARDACLDVREAIEANPALIPVVRSKIGTMSALVELREPDPVAA